MKFYEEIKTVTFDVGFTIIFPAEPVGVSYQRHLTRHGIELPHEKLEQSFFDAWTDYVSARSGLLYGTTLEEGLSTWRILLKSMLLKSDVQIADSVVNDISDNIFHEFAKAPAWSIHPHWKSIVARCRRKGLKIGLVSNWDVRLDKLLKELGIDRQVDFQIISAEHGLEKPDKKIFELAARKGQCNLDQLLHVGDTFLDDVTGAVTAGAKSIWCNHRKQLTIANDLKTTQFRVINDLSELVIF